MSVCTNCIALKRILSCEWKLWQPLLSLRFYQRSTQWNHGNNMWHIKKKQWNQSQHILWLEFIETYSTRKGTWSAEHLDSVLYPPLNKIQCIKAWYYVMQKWMSSLVNLLLQIEIWHFIYSSFTVYEVAVDAYKEHLFLCQTYQYWYYNMHFYPSSFAFMLTSTAFWKYLR